MKRISRNLTAAALASSLSLAGVAAASAEENTEPNATDLVDAIVKADETGKTETGKTEGENGAGKTEGENGKTEGENGAGKTEGEKPGNNENKPGNNENKPGKDDANKPGNNENKPGKDDANKPGKDDANKKEKSSFDDIKSKLSSEDGKPTKLGIAGIVAGVLAAIAAVVPAAAQALNIKLPF